MSQTRTMDATPYGLLHSPVCKSLRRHKVCWDSRKRTRCKTSFHYFRFVSKYDRLHHAIIIRSSAISLVISNPRSAPPHVTRNVAQNTRPSLHVREGLGTRLGSRLTSPARFQALPLLGSKPFPCSFQSSLPLLGSKPFHCSVPGSLSLFESRLRCLRA